MKFTKMHGCGNDYVYVNGATEKVDDPAKVSIYVSDRHFGIGSDGLIMINPSDVADFEMAMYNADGSRGEMCGNGIRCVGKYVYDHGLTDKTHLTIETLAGIKILDLNVVDGKVKTVKVDMGAPIFEASAIPTNYEGDKVLRQPLKVNGTHFEVSCISMGNPHCITYVDDVMNINIEKIGPYFENHEMFPKRINTEFVQVVDKKHLKMRVWERGSGETFACGTGACACAVATMENGLCEDEVWVELLGGTLKITYDRANNTVIMEGPATTVFEGEINIK